MVVLAKVSLLVSEILQTPAIIPQLPIQAQVVQAITQELLPLREITPQSIFFRFLSCAYVYLHDNNPKTLKLGHDATFPIED